MEIWQLRQMQSLPLEVKIEKTRQRVKEFYETRDGGVYTSDSGGLDSTVLGHIVDDIYSDIPHVCNACVECKENQECAKSNKNIVVVTSEMSRVEVLQKFGFPIGSKKIARQIWDIRHPTEDNAATRHLYLTGEKRDGTMSKSFKLSEKWKKLIDAPFEVSNKCCKYLKHDPMNKYEKETKRKPLTGERAEEGTQRRVSYLQTGCNNFRKGEEKSKPLGFWTHQDILEYLVKYKVKHSKAYGDIICIGYTEDDKPIYKTTKAARTGCDICGFGLHLEERPHRFDRMQIDDPKAYDYWVNKMGWGKAMDYAGIKYGLDTWQKEWAPSLRNHEQYRLAAL